MLRVLSIAGIAAALVVAAGMLRMRALDWRVALFLVTTVLTSITGFFFHRDQLLPSRVVGVVSIIVLCLTLIALYRYRLSGAWRGIYVSGALVALYLNVFVLIAQAFQKIARLSALAPTQSDPVFIIIQVGVLTAFLLLTFGALRCAHSPATTGHETM